MFLGWTVNVAKKHGIFHALFSTHGAYSTSIFFSLWLHLPHGYTDTDEFGLPGFPDTFHLHRLQLSRVLQEASEEEPRTKFLQRQLRYCLGSNGILCNMVEEMEKTRLQLLRNNLGLPVWCVGPLLPPFDLCSSSQFHHLRPRKKPGISIDDCIKWLNHHPPLSVLYISFGSQNSVSISQMMELAMGLEASGKPFIWVIRPPFGHSIDEDFKSEWLPEGFETRMTEGNRGLLVYRWAPQLEILSHGSTGMFLSHCGWNSVMESLSQGVPMIGWPLAAEQFYNSMMLDDELGVCVELARGVDDNVVQQRVAKVIGIVIGETEKGKEMKTKAAELREILKAGMTIRDQECKDGSLNSVVDEFLMTCRLKTRKTSESDGMKIAV